MEFDLETSQLDRVTYSVRHKILQLMTHAVKQFLEGEIVWKVFFSFSEASNFLD